MKIPPTGQTLTDLYSSQASLILRLVSLAFARRSLTSWAVCLVTASTSMSWVSSRRLPWLLLSLRGGLLHGSRGLGLGEHRGGGGKMSTCVSQREGAIPCALETGKTPGYVSTAPEQQVVLKLLDLLLVALHLLQQRLPLLLQFVLLLQNQLAKQLVLEACGAARLRGSGRNCQERGLVWLRSRPGLVTHCCSCIGGPIAALRKAVCSPWQASDCCVAARNPWRPPKAQRPPAVVTVKSTTVTLAHSSGVKCGLGSRVVAKRRKVSVKSTSLSASWTTQLLPLRTCSGRGC